MENSTKKLFIKVKEKISGANVVVGKYSEVVDQSQTRPKN